MTTTGTTEARVGQTTVRLREQHRMRAGRHWLGIVGADVVADVYTTSGTPGFRMVVRVVAAARFPGPKVKTYQSLEDVESALSAALPVSAVTK